MGQPSQIQQAGCQLVLATADRAPGDCHLRSPLHGGSAGLTDGHSSQEQQNETIFTQRPNQQQQQQQRRQPQECNHPLSGGGSDAALCSLFPAVRPLPSRTGGLESQRDRNGSNIRCAAHAGEAAGPQLMAVLPCCANVIEGSCLAQRDPEVAESRDCSGGAVCAGRSLLEPAPWPMAPSQPPAGKRPFTDVSAGGHEKNDKAASRLSVQLEPSPVPAKTKRACNEAWLHVVNGAAILDAETAAAEPPPEEPDKPPPPAGLHLCMQDQVALPSPAGHLAAPGLDAEASSGNQVSEQRQSRSLGQLAMVSVAAPDAAPSGAGGEVAQLVTNTPAELAAAGSLYGDGMASSPCRVSPPSVPPGQQALLPHQRRFVQLQKFLRRCDDSTDISARLSDLLALSAEQRCEAAAQLEQRTLLLAVVEGKEMLRVKHLGVMSRRT